MKWKKYCVDYGLHLIDIEKLSYRPKTIGLYRNAILLLTNDPLTFPLLP